MTDNLTKTDKRSCRELIHVGLERECEKFVAEVKALASKPIRYFFFAFETGRALQVSHTKAERRSRSSTSAM